MLHTRKHTHTHFGIHWESGYLPGVLIGPISPTQHRHSPFRMRASEFFDLSRFQSSYTTARPCVRVRMCVRTFIPTPSPLNRVVSSLCQSCRSSRFASFIPFSPFYSPFIPSLSISLLLLFSFFLLAEHSQLDSWSTRHVSTARVAYLFTPRRRINVKRGQVYSIVRRIRHGSRLDEHRPRRFAAVLEPRDTRLLHEQLSQPKARRETRGCTRIENQLKTAETDTLARWKGLYEIGEISFCPLR